MPYIYNATGKWRSQSAPVNKIWNNYDAKQRAKVNLLWDRLRATARRADLHKGADLCAVILLRSLDPLEDE